MRYTDSSDSWKALEHLMHGQVLIGHGVLMAWDVPPRREGHPQADVSVMQILVDPGTARAAFKRQS